MSRDASPLTNISGFERRGIDLDDGHVSYQVGGVTGPAVILLHGASLDNGSITWRQVAEDLSRDHRVYTPDLPKHGASWPWRARADQRGLESVVIDLMDAWGVGSASLVGLSMGAAVALGTALNNPERVDALVLAACGGIQDRVRAHEISYLSLRAPISWALTRLQSPKALEDFARSKLPYADDVTDQDVDFLARAYRVEYEAKRRGGGHLFSDWNRFEVGFRRMRTNFMPRMEELRRPTLFLHGDRDDAVPLALAEEAARRTLLGRIQVIEGASHFLPQDHPVETVRAVREFLEEIER